MERSSPPEEDALYLLRPLRNYLTIVYYDQEYLIVETPEKEQVWLENRPYKAAELFQKLIVNKNFRSTLKNSLDFQAALEKEYPNIYNTPDFQDVIGGARLDEVNKYDLIKKFDAEYKRIAREEARKVHKEEMDKFWLGWTKSSYKDKIQLTLIALAALAVAVGILVPFTQSIIRANVAETRQASEQSLYKEIYENRDLIFKNRSIIEYIQKQSKIHSTSSKNQSSVKPKASN